MNEALVGHLFPPKAAFPPPSRLTLWDKPPLLTQEEIAHALSKSSALSAPGPHGIPYLTWKRVNTINPSILLHMLSPLVSLEYHPASLNVAKGVVFDKPGKPSDKSPTSLTIIVLLRTVSKILERIIGPRFHLAARSRGLIHLNQCCSLPGLRTYDACLPLVNDVKAFQRRRLEVSSVFLDIKASFDNVDNLTLARILTEGGVPLYLVSWVTTCQGERNRTLVFQSALGTPAPVNLGAPEGSPVSPLLFVIYVAPLHFRIPRGLMFSYMDNFPLMTTHLCYRGNIRQLQRLFRTIQAWAGSLGISFSIRKKGTHTLENTLPKPLAVVSLAHSARRGDL